MLARQNATSATALSSNNTQLHHVYSFPLLKASEIFAVIRNMHIPVNEDDIRKAEPAATRKVFEIFIENIMGISREELSQPAFSGLRALDYPELHEESIPELAFLRTINRLMGFCGIYDFNLRDLLTPTPKRLRKHLSALINFAKFREERLQAFSALSKDTEALLRQRSAQQEENEKLEAELEALLQERAAEEPAIEQLRQECQHFEQEINTLNTRQATLRHETGQLKAKSMEIHSDLASYEARIVEAKEEKRRLEDQIVSSPDRLKAEIAQISVSIEEAREEVSECDKKHRKFLVMRDTFQRTEKDIIKTVQLLEDLDTVLEKCKNAKRSVKDHKRDMEENHQRAIEYLAHRKRLEKILEAKHQDMANFKEEASIMIQAAQHALDATRQELQQVENNQNCVQDRINHYQSKRRHMERKMQEQEAKCQREVHEIKEMFKRLESAVMYYDNMIAQAMEFQYSGKKSAT